MLVIKQYTVRRIEAALTLILTSVPKRGEGLASRSGCFEVLRLSSCFQASAIVLNRVSLFKFNITMSLFYFNNFGTEPATF